MAKSELKTVKNVMFVYTHTHVPQKQLNTDGKPPMSEHPLELHSYEVKIAMGESRYKTFKDSFRGARNLPNVKDFKRTVFHEKYCSDSPITDLPDEDIYLITFRQSAMTGRSGERREARPIGQIGCKRTVMPNSQTIYTDADGVEIKQDTPVGNGTLGHLQFNPATMEMKGQKSLYLYPVAICITKLVEYHSSVSGPSEEDFGVEEVSPSTTSTEFDDFDDDIAF
jgi:hypothetical protein